MDDGKIDADIICSISHWGMFDTSVTDGLVIIRCDSDGMPIGQEFEPMNEVLPLLVVEYENRGQLIIMGDHVTGMIRERLWYPDFDGAMPPRDEFTNGMLDRQGAPSNATRH